MVCSSCGAAASEGTAFCGSCGRPIIGYSVGPASAGSAVGSSAGGAYIPSAVRRTEDTGLYAGFWLRVVASIIDSFILAIPFGIVFFAMFASLLPLIVTRTQNPTLILMAIMPKLLLGLIFVLVGSWLYWALTESSEWQATPGKKVMGLYVTDLYGNRVSFGKASGRYFAGRGISCVPSVGGLYYLIDCLMAGFTEKKQALHDIIAGCLVSRRN